MRTLSGTLSAALGGQWLGCRVNGRPELQRQLAEISERRMAAALATAMTRTVVGARMDLRDEAWRAFDNPRPFVVNAIRFKGATATQLQASVFVPPDSPVEPALRVQALGGTRAQKRFEALGSSFGLPSGQVAVPGPGADLDQHGNIRRAQLRQILQLTKARASTKRSSRRGGGGALFIMPAGKGHPGVYMRRPDRSIVALLLFVQRANYRPLFNFYEVGHDSIARRFPGEMKRAFDDTISRWLQQQGRR